MKSLVLASALLAFGFSSVSWAQCSTETETQVSKAAPKDIVATAVGAGSFETLVIAVKAAGLVEVLQGPGPFTVFAPNDEAFAKLPKGTLEALLNDPAKLKAVLTYHVVPGKLMASDVLGGAQLRTVQGQSLKASQKEGDVRIDGARVLSTDIPCSNGVIHVIDSVVLPK